MNKRIRTVLYNDQRFFRTELDILHTPIVQRLYDLHQLGLTDRVFVDASHTRFSHVIGVMEQASKICTALIRNLKNCRDKKFELQSDECYTGSQLMDHLGKKERALRLMALFHDLTHGPYGHTLEDEIELFSQKHDEPARQAEAFWIFIHQYVARTAIAEFGELNWAVIEKTHSVSQPPASVMGALTSAASNKTLDKSALANNEDHVNGLAQFVVELIAYTKKRTRRSKSMLSIRETYAVLEDLEFAFTALLHLEVLHKVKPKPKHIPDTGSYPFINFFRALRTKDPVGFVNSKAGGFHATKDAFFLDIIGNTICADLLDYAKRDSVHSGLKLDYDVDRIVDNFTLIVKPNSYDAAELSPEDSARLAPLHGNAIRTAISIFEKKLRLDVIGELMNLLQVRYYVYERMLFHPTKCIAGALLGRAIQTIGLQEMPQSLKFCGDNVFIERIRLAAEYSVEFTSTPDDSINPARLPHSLLDTVNAIEAGLNADTKRQNRILQCIAYVIEANASREDYASDLRKSTGRSFNRMKEEKLEPKERVKIIENITKTLPAYAPWLNPQPADKRRRIADGLRLLDDLNSRRYPRRVFAMLPMRVKANALTEVSPQSIAECFKDPITRLCAEIEIERRCGLPQGTAIIHCPPASGPTKIANVYITDGQAAAAVTLSHVDQLSDVYGQLLKSHVAIIKNLEEQYQSIWRLTVSFRPPYDLQFLEHQSTIETVISDIITRGSNQKVLKEHPMILRELNSEITEIDDDFDLRAEKEKILIHEILERIGPMPIVANYYENSLAADDPNGNVNSAKEVVESLFPKDDLFK